MTSAARRARRGTTLIELLAALTALGVLGTAAVGLLGAMMRAVQLQRGAGGVAATVRAAGAILPSELRGLAPADLVAIATDSISYRATRTLGVVCAASATEVRLRAGADWSFGWRAPSPGRDTLLLFADADPSSEADDRWLAVPVLGVGPATCGAASATAIATRLDSAAASALVTGGPARIAEVMQVKLYQTGGSWWLGARSVSAGETVQPVVGPLAARGLAFVALDSAGAPTTVAASARSVSVSLRALSEPLHHGAVVTTLTDSVATVLRLRNAPWP